MRRLVLAALLAVLAVPFLAPAASAAARLEITDADVFNLDGLKLSRVGNGQTVSFIAQVKNVGDANRSGPVPLVFHVQSDDGVYEDNRTVTTELPLDPGETANVTLEWTASYAGDHVLEVYIEGRPQGTFTLRFTVSETEVLRGNLGQRFVQYLWVYGAFIATLVLFVAVARYRK